MKLFELQKARFMQVFQKPIYWLCKNLWIFYQLTVYTDFLAITYIIVSWSAVLNKEIKFRQLICLAIETQHNQQAVPLVFQCFL